MCLGDIKKKSFVHTRRLIDTGQTRRNLTSTYTSDNIFLRVLSMPRYASFAILRGAAPTGALEHGMFIFEFACVEFCWIHNCFINFSSYDHRLQCNVQRSASSNSLQDQTLRPTVLWSCPLTQNTGFFGEFLLYRRKSTSDIHGDWANWVGKQVENELIKIEHKSEEHSAAGRNNSWGCQITSLTQKR